MKIYDIKKTVAFDATEEHPRHSEASVIQCKDGSLRMVWQRFSKSTVGSNDHAPATVMIADCPDGRPEESGWVNIRTAAERTESCVNVYSPNLIRLKDSVALIFMRYMRLAPGEISLASAFIKLSYDEGKTFGEERMLWDKLPITFSNDCIFRSRTGRIVLPVTHSGGAWGKDQAIRVSTVYSDDEGKTWSFSDHRVFLPMRGAMEPFIAQCSDGRLVMVMRNQLGSLMQCYSCDDGITWTKPQTTGLSIPESCPYITNVPDTDTLMVIWNNAEYDPQYVSHFGRRTPLTVAFSDDNGRSYHDITDIEDDPAMAYSNPGVTWTEDGRCILTYWTTEYKPNGRMGGPISLKLAAFKVKK